MVYEVFWPSFVIKNWLAVRNCYAERTNIDASLFPCKVFESQTVDNFVVYKFFCPSVVIKNWFPGEELTGI